MPARVALVRLSFAAGLLCLSSLSARAETRTWTDSSGKYKVEADFLEIKEGQVYLERTDGKKMNLPLAKLSKDDQAYLRDLMKQRRAGATEADNPFREVGEETPGFGAGVPRDLLNEIDRQMGAAMRSSRFPRGAGDDERPYNVGDQVEVEEFGKWQRGEVVGFDANGHTTFVKLANGTMVDAHGSFSIRPYDPSPLAGVAEDQLARVDLTRIRRIVPLGGSEGGFKPDPAPAAKSHWKPKPIGLNPKTNFFNRVVDVSFTKAGATGAIGHLNVHERESAMSQIELCDLKSGQVTAVVRGPRGLTRVAVSPSGQRLITISEPQTFESGPLQLWELSGDELKHLKSWYVNSGERGDRIEWIGWLDDERIITVDRISLTMWTIDGPRGVYQITGEDLKAPAFSPGGKQMAVGTSSGVSVHDVATGELLTRINMNHSFGRHVAFSPSGKLLAVTGASTVDVFDLATGKKTVSAYAASAGSDKGLAWLDEEHVLVGGSDLIHLPSQMTVWKYEHNAESVVQLADRMWYVFAGGAGNESMALLPFDLPHAAVKPVSDRELVLKPGDEVSVQTELAFDLGVDVQGNPVSVQDQLTAALGEAGFKVVDNSEKKLIARTQSGETKEIAYRMFGAGFETQKTSYTQRVLELELMVDGESVWKRRRVMDAPFHLQLKENESVDQALNRVLTADVGFFRSTVPSRVLPSAAEKARTSTLSINGLQ